MSRSLSRANGGVERLQLSMYGHSDLASPDQFCIFSHCYVLDNGDSYCWLSRDVDKAGQLLFPEILVLVLFPMWMYYFNGCVHALNLVIAAQIEIMRELLLVFTGL
jgi:hypothetical protein